MLPSKRIEKLYEETNKKVIAAENLSQFQDLVIEQNARIFIEISKILDELHEEKKEDEFIPDGKTATFTLSHKPLGNVWFNNVEYTPVKPTPCSDPDCECKFSKCCKADTIFQLDRGRVCEQSFKPFIPSSCKATEEKKEATDTKVESWEEEFDNKFDPLIIQNSWDNTGHVARIDGEQFTKLKDFIRRTRAEAISEHNREVKEAMSKKIFNDSEKLWRGLEWEMMIKHFLINYKEELISLPILNK